MKQALSLLRTVWRNQRRQYTLPRFLTYLVTFTCDARCIMCDSWRKSSPDELTVKEIAGIFAQLPRMDAVRLTGGEPFLRPDLLEIAHQAQKKLQPLILHITTNGFPSRRIVRFCEERRKDVPLRLLVSVDGMKEKHNHIRGRETAWDRAVHTLEVLAPRRKELRLNLSVNQTIVDAEGIDQYVRLRDFLRPLGIHNHVVVGYEVSATYDVKKDVNLAPTEIGQFTSIGKFTPEQVQKLLGEVEKDLGNYPFFERIAKGYYLQGIRSRMLGQAGYPNPKCVALNAHLRLLPDGLVPTCQFNSITVGDLRRQRFEDIWFGDKIQGQRNWVYRCSGCWAECEVLPNALYTGDLARALIFKPGIVRPQIHSQPLFLQR